MSVTLHAPHGNFRANMVRIAGALTGVEVKLHQTEYSETKTAEFKKLNPLGKLPVIVTAEGPVFETNAILRHLARTSGKLYGSNNYESALVDQYLDMCSCELMPAAMAVLLPIFGYVEYNHETVKTAKEELLKTLKIYDERLSTHKFLAGEHLTIADVQLVVLLTLVFRTASSEEKRKQHKHVVDYFTRVAATPEFVKFLGRVHLTAAEWEAPVSAEKKDNKKKDAKQATKTEKPAAEKKETKKVEKKEEKKEEKVEEEEAPAGEAKWNLYDWKTLYTNAKDKNEAIKNLIENFKEGELCLYHLHYQKYEGEGEVLHIFNNLKNGFIQRCEEARKKAFGTYSIYGEEPKLDISGVWLFIGADIPQEMKNNPQFEYHDLKKLCLNKPEDLETIKAYWCNTTDDESVVNGLRLRSFATFK